MAHSAGFDYPADNRSHGSRTGPLGPPPDMGASYNDPAHVRQWAASSTAGVDPFTDPGAGTNLPTSMPSDFGPTYSLACAVSQPEFALRQLEPASLEHSQHLGFDYQCTNMPVTEGMCHCLNNCMSSLPTQGYETSPAHAESLFDGGVAFQTDSLAYPTPLTDDLSFFDAPGANAMCRQPSSHGFGDYSAEWSSQASSHGSTGIPNTDVMPGSQPMSLTTSSQFGSSVSSSQSQASLIDTPLSMTILDDGWPLNNATHVENMQFPSLGIPENMHLPPAHCPVDQRFEFCSLHQRRCSNTPYSTLRPHNPIQRPRLPDMDAWGQLQNEPAVSGYVLPQFNLTSTSRRPSDGEPTVTARKHLLYQAQPRDDGLYHCPFEESEDCKHNPEKLKCNYE